MQPHILKSRFSILYLFFTVFILLSFIIRTALLIKSLPDLDLSIWSCLIIYGTGLFYDVLTMFYFAIPYVLYLLLIPDRVYQCKLHKLFAGLVVFASLYLLVFAGVAEYLFFDEFGTRFNFVAVDYLVYTQEVMKNIQQSYPLLLLFSLLTCVSLAGMLLLKKRLAVSLAYTSSFRSRVKTGIVFLLVPVASYALVDVSLPQLSANAYVNELSANGIYTLFAAFRNNQIDYPCFYVTRDDHAVLRQLRALLQEPNSSFVTNEEADIRRDIHNQGVEKHLNVVMIVVESLSAEFLGISGNKDNLTPNLDSLAPQGLYFTNMYATGTRTDRGLESLTLSVPPTPGRSIVKRPDNENMFSVGFIMKSRGYDTKFIYGGYGYFDNMNCFFSNNGFATIDRTDFAAHEITFENAWGVCDEDLFSKSIKEFNKSYSSRKPFLALIMTTSNHRPFTYPEGRIDIPSHSGRKGAVKYTDYAIGKFLRDAALEPWFKDTLVVIVADHCAGSAGKTALPVKKYKIPLLIFAPAHVKPQRIDTMASQIDIAPTILGLLNYSYRSKFFGRDILRVGPGRGRALIGNYQKVGYLISDRLAVLDVKKQVGMYQVELLTGESKIIPIEQNIVDETISYYQGADYLFKNHRNRRDE